MSRNSNERITDNMIEDIETSKTDKEQTIKKKKHRKIKPVFIVAMLIVVLIVGGTYTWYYYHNENQGDRKDVKIMTPYFLYLLNPDSKTSLEFTVGNIHPGETKQIVICVSNKKPEDVTEDFVDIARESKFNYDLQFLYTENLPVDYKIYELTKSTYDDVTNIPDTGIVVEGVDKTYWEKSTGKLDANGNPQPLEITKDVTNERHQSVFGDTDVTNIINKGKYLLYQYDGQKESQPLGLEYKNGQYEYDYYLIEINWKDDVNFNDYTKETDLLYVVVNAKQPKPTR